MTAGTFACRRRRPDRGRSIQYPRTAGHAGWRWEQSASLSTMSRWRELNWWTCCGQILRFRFWVNAVRALTRWNLCANWSLPYCSLMCKRRAASGVRILEQRHQSARTQLMEMHAAHRW